MSDLPIRLDLPAKGSRRRLNTIHQQLRAAIESGRLPPASRLPPSRQLANQLEVSRTSVITVYERLRSEGYLESRPGGGTFVSSNARVAKSSRRAPSARPPLSAAARMVLNPWRPERTATIRFDLRLGRTDTTRFPYDVWRRLSARVWRANDDESADYQAPEGAESLRAAIAGHVAATRGVACASHDVLITNGAQQAFDLIARALVTPGKTKVVVENPGYPGTMQAFALAGAKMCPVEVDAEGIRVDRIPKDAKIIAVSPSHQFPTGVALSLERRQALLHLADQIGAVIVEDDYDCEFRFDHRPLDALRTLASSERVIYVGTFSKTLFPALRMGFLVTPDWLRPALAGLRQALDWHAPVATQATLAAFIGEGHLMRHIRRMTRIYAKRRKTLLDALADQCSDWLTPLPQVAGLHLSARIAGKRDARAHALAAGEQGVAVAWVNRYALSPTSTDGLAFGFAVCPTSRIEEAVARVAKAAKLVRSRK